MINGFVYAEFVDNKCAINDESKNQLASNSRLEDHHKSKILIWENFKNKLTYAT